MPYVRRCPYCRKCFMYSTYQMISHAMKCKEVNPYPTSNPTPLPSNDI